MSRARRAALAALAVLLVLAGGGAVLALVSPGRGAGRHRPPDTAPARVMRPVPTAPTSTTAPSGPASLPGASVLGSGLAAALAGRTACVDVVAQGRVVTSQGASAALAPASTQKLLTGAAALRVLGPYHRFVTRVVAAAPPSGGTVPRVWLVGSGDPVLSSGPWTALVLSHSHYRDPPATPLVWLSDALRQAGITSVPGGIAGDDSLYPDGRWLPTWKPVYLAEGDVGPLSALSVDEGWKAFGRRWVPDADPAAHAADLLSADLRAAGVAVGPVAPDQAAPAGAVTVATVTSPPLADIVAYMLATSDNHIAELLTRAVGLATSGSGTTAAGTRAVLKEAARLGVPTGGAVMQDGSGLSPGNRATCPELLAAYRLGDRPEYAALRWGVPVAGRTGTLYDTWRGTVLAGRVAAKTGWINGAAAIVGTVAGPDPVDFSLIVNGRFDYGQALAVEGQALGAMVQFTESPGAGPSGG